MPVMSCSGIMANAVPKAETLVLLLNPAAVFLDLLESVTAFIVYISACVNCPSRNLHAIRVV